MEQVPNPGLHEEVEDGILEESDGTETILVPPRSCLNIPEPGQGWA